MSFLFDESYYKIGKNGVSPAQNMCAYLGGSAIQTVGDNPVTAYRQLVQQYAKDVNGNTVAPKVAVGEANATFRANPIGRVAVGPVAAVDRRFAQTRPEVRLPAGLLALRRRGHAGLRGGDVRLYL